MKPPRKRLELTIKLHAHDWDEVDRLLHQIETDFALGYMRCGGASGSGYSISVDEDPTAPNAQEFDRLLMEWNKATIAGRKAARGD